MTPWPASSSPERCATRPDPAVFDPDEDLVQTYGITSLSKVLFLTSLCKAAEVGLDKFTEADLVRMRTLGNVVEALRPHAPQKG